MNHLPFDMSVYRRERIHALEGDFAWGSAGVAGMSAEKRAAWQTEFRQRFDSTLGGLSQWTRPPLEPSVTEVRQFAGYHRETVTFTTRPGLRACGYFLVPDNCPPGRPAILCLPGHGRGVDSIVGIAPDGTQRRLGQPDEYASDFALQCAAQGYPAFALEMIGFGTRRDAAARAAGPEATSCIRDSMAALMLGETLPGWRVWDAMRALDYLQTRTEYVDPDRLAVMGISGGGLAALFAVALDTRLSAAVISGYFNTYAASVLSIDHCVDNYAPGLLRLGEMPDLAALIAPRALFVESGRLDPIFPISAFEQAAAQAKETFDVFGAPECFGAAVFEGGHRFHGNAAFAFLQTRLPASK